MSTPRRPAIGRARGSGSARWVPRAPALSLLVATCLACSPASGSGAPEGPPPGRSRTFSAPAASAGGDAHALCDRFEAAAGTAARFEVLEAMAAGEDPRPESHESFFGADRKLWLWAGQALRAAHRGDESPLRLAIERIRAECAGLD